MMEHSKGLVWSLPSASAGRVPHTEGYKPMRKPVKTPRQRLAEFVPLRSAKHLVQKAEPVPAAEAKA